MKRNLVKINKNLRANFGLLRGLGLILLLGFGCFGQEFIPPWEKGKMPNTKGLELKDDIRNERIYTVGTPGFYAFFPSNQENKAVSPRNSLMFYNALLVKKISASLHIFPNGGHAIALRNNPGSTEEWTKLCEMWLIEMGFILQIKK